MMNEKEMAEHLLNKMTVDMSIDFWQTKECAIASVDVILWNVLNVMELSDEEVSEDLQLLSCDIGLNLYFV